MKETTKMLYLHIYTFFLNSLENSPFFMNGKHYFRKSNGTYSHFYADGAKLMVSGGGVETHAVDTNNEKDIALLACAFYRIFV